MANKAKRASIEQPNRIAPGKRHRRPIPSRRCARPQKQSARERLEAEGAGPPPIRNYCISEVEQIADHAERGQSHNQLHADRQVWGHKMAADAPGESAKNDKSRKSKKDAQEICRGSVRHKIPCVSLPTIGYSVYACQRTERGPSGTPAKVVLGAACVLLP